VALLLFWVLARRRLLPVLHPLRAQRLGAWTEEIARYLLIGTVVFVGASIGVAKNNHIQVDFLYRYLPGAVGRVLSRAGRPAAHRLLRRHDGAHGAC
jgi:TRAP-type transport system small permease protein